MRERPRSWRLMIWGALGFLLFLSGFASNNVVTMVVGVVLALSGTSAYLTLFVASEHWMKKATEVISAFLSFGIIIYGYIITKSLVLGVIAFFILGMFLLAFMLSYLRPRIARALGKIYGQDERAPTGQGSPLRMGYEDDFDKYIVARDMMFVYRRCPFCGVQVWDYPGGRPPGFIRHLNLGISKHMDNPEWFEYQKQREVTELDRSIPISSRIGEVAVLGLVRSAWLNIVNDLFGLAYCPHCGKELANDADARLCQHCGLQRLAERLEKIFHNVVTFDEATNTITVLREIRIDKSGVHSGGPAADRCRIEFNKLIIVKWLYNDRKEWWELTCPNCRHLNKRWTRTDVRNGQFICDSCKEQFAVSGHRRMRSIANSIGHFIGFISKPYSASYRVR